MQSWASLVPIWVVDFQYLVAFGSAFGSAFSFAFLAADVAYHCMDVFVLEKK